MFLDMKNSIIDMLVLFGYKLYVFKGIVVLYVCCGICFCLLLIGGY